jgi:predicted  nucleic acid-binding Zn-ribbon protein
MWVTLMDMVQALFELQEMEGDLQKSKTDLAEVVSRLDHNEGVTKSRDRSARAKQAFTRLQMTQAELDVDVQATTARLKELDQRLYSGNTVASKDLLALQHEIKFTKEKQSDLEGKLLAKMEQVEAGQKAIATIDAELASVESAREAEIPTLQKRQEQLEQHAKAIALAYQTAEAAVAPSDLKTYRVLQKSKGTAVAQVDRGLCSGCIIAIPSRELQMLRTATTPMRCSSCGRFLFIAG